MDVAEPSSKPLTRTGASITFSQDRHVGEEVELLEDHARVHPHAADLLPLVLGPVTTLEPDAGHLDRSRRGVLQEVHAAQQGALARARAAEDDDDLALQDLHVDALQDLEGPEALVEVLRPDDDLSVALTRHRAHLLPPLRPEGAGRCVPRLRCSRWPTPRRTSPSPASFFLLPLVDVGPWRT